MTTFDALNASEELLNAYESLHESEKALEDVQLIMHNIQQSISLINQYGQDSIKFLNADEGLENLLKISEQSMTVEKVLEGFGQAMSEAWKKFVDIVKKIIDKIHVWLKTFIDKIRTTSPDLRDKLSDRLAKQYITDKECVAATAGNMPFGRSIAESFSAIQKLKVCAKNIESYVNITDVDKARTEAFQLFFETVTDFKFYEIKSSGEDENQWISSHIYTIRDNDEVWFANDAERKDLRGLKIEYVKLLETAQKDALEALVEFDSAFSVYAKRLLAKIDAEKDPNNKELYWTLVKGLHAASKSNGRYYATVSWAAGKMLKAYENVVMNYKHDICPRCGWKRTPGESQCRNCGTHF